jgi:hypothetical protein
LDDNAQQSYDRGTALRLSSTYYFNENNESICHYLFHKNKYCKVCQYLCTIDIPKNGLYGGGNDLDLPVKLYNVRTSIEKQYAITPTDSTLTETSNYLYALCGKYALAAQAIVLGSGGSIPSVVAGTTPLPYQFMVDASTSFITNGESSKTISSFIGYNLLFVRNNITQSTVNDGVGSYYSWSKSTGVFTMYPQQQRVKSYNYYHIKNKTMRFILLTIFLFIIGQSFGQFPISQTMGSPSTQVYSKGAFGSDSGFVFRVTYLDTTSANKGWIDNIPGIVIRVGG